MLRPKYIFRRNTIQSTTLELSYVTTGFIKPKVAFRVDCRLPQMEATSGFALLKDSDSCTGKVGDASQSSMS